MLKTLLIIALLLSAVDAFGQSASGNLSVTVTPPGSTSPGSGPFGLTLDASMSDEFNGSSLDTSKWTVGWQGGCTDPCNFSGMDVSVSGGNLRLVQHNSGGVYHPAGIYGKSGVMVMPSQPSYWEVRAILPACGNACGSAVWMMDLANTPHTEIDAQETFAANMCANVHMWNAGYANDIIFSGQPSTSNGGGELCGGSGNWTDGQYHTYGVHRFNNQLDFYFDGALSGTITASGTNANLVFTSPTNLILNTDGNNGLHPPDGTTVLVDYSRVYH